MPTTDMDGRRKEISNLMQDIKEFLKNGFKGEIQEPLQLIKYYWEVSRRADQLIRLTLGENGRLPVDIELLAQKLGARVVVEDLNEFPGWKSMNRRIGQVEIGNSFFTDEKMRTIFVDKKASFHSKRYAIAHEIAHYIMHYNDRDYYEDYFIMPMCPKELDEIVADIFAIFLLIPVRYFFVEFLEYVKRKMDEGGEPIATEQWIRYLAEKSVISDYYVAYGYQQLRYVAYWIYLAWHGDDDKEIFNCNDDTDSETRKKMSDEDREQVRRETEDYYTEEMGDWLFE